MYLHGLKTRICIEGVQVELMRYASFVFFGQSRFDAKDKAPFRSGAKRSEYSHMQSIPAPVYVQRKTRSYLSTQDLGQGWYDFQGNDVRDKNSEIAVFESLSSSPAVMEGSRALDAFDCMNDRNKETGDAEQTRV